MQLSGSERLILIMLSDIYKKLGMGGGGEINPDFIQEAIWSNNTWGISWEYASLLDGSMDPTPPEVNEVVNYLDMWTFIESAIDKLSPQDLSLLQEKVGLSIQSMKFKGFDGNNESRYLSIASFLINDLRRFTNFKERDLNSHMSILGNYRRMFLAFQPMRRELVGQGLDVSQLEKIFNARL